MQLSKEKNDMAAYKVGSFDFGPEEIFLPLAGRCGPDRAVPRPMT